MRIEGVEVTAMVNVDVTAEEFIAELAAQPVQHQGHLLVSTISTCYGVLRRIPSEMIASLKNSQRALIADALHKEAKRYEQG